MFTLNQNTAFDQQRGSVRDFRGTIAHSRLAFGKAPSGSRIPWARGSHLWKNHREDRVEHYSQRTLTPGLTSAHVPSIEGLFHGGQAEQMRQMQTDFGSGWQGIYKRMIRSLGSLSTSVRADERVVENAGLLLGALRKQPAGKAVAESLSRLGTRGMTYLGGGLERVVFDLGDERVLKLGLRHDPDLPKVPEILQPLYKRSINGVSVEVAPKVQLAPIDTSIPMELEHKLQNRGYHWYDKADRNVGIFKGKPVVIDPGFIKKSQIRRTLRTEAMRYGADPAVISRKLDMLVRDSGVKNPAALSPSVIGELREHIRNTKIFRQRAMKQKLMNLGHKAVVEALESGKSKAAAGKVTGAVARIVRGV